MKYFIFIAMFFILSACGTNLTFTEIEEETNYYIIKENQKLLSFRPPKGFWKKFHNLNHPENETHNSKVILIGQSPFHQIGYEARISIQNMNSFVEEKKQLINFISSENYLDSAKQHASEYYTERLIKEQNIISTNSSVTKIGGFFCTKIDEFKSYGPSADNPKWGNTHLDISNTFISCPLVIDSEIWALSSFYSFRIPTNKFNQFYEGNPPSIEEIRYDLEARLQPMLNSVFVYRNPSQKYTNDEIVAD